MANEEAVKPPEETRNGGPDREPGKRPRFLRVKVIENGRPKVNVMVPIGVAKWGMKMAQTYSPEMKGVDLDWESITSMIQEGEQGKIVEVEDEAQHKTVEVWVE